MDDVEALLLGVIVTAALQPPTPAPPAPNTQLVEQAGKSAFLSGVSSYTLSFSPPLQAADYGVELTFVPADGVVPGGWGVDPDLRTAAACRVRFTGTFTGTLIWRVKCI